MIVYCGSMTFCVYCHRAETRVTVVISMGDTEPMVCVLHSVEEGHSERSVAVVQLSVSGGHL